MAETSQVVSSLDGKETPPPPATGDVKKRSDERMAGFMKHIQRKEANSANFTSPTPTKGDKPDGAAQGNQTPPVTSQAPAPPAQTEKKVEPPTPPVQTKPDDKPEPPAKPKDSKVNWEEEAQKHQSRADKLDEQLKGFTGKKVIPEEEYAQLVEAKTNVDSFVKDPVGFMLKYTPQLAQQLAMAGDPVKLVEVEVANYKKQLDEQYKSQFGEDWRVDPSEMNTPGTPSFRYNLAINDKVDDVRRQYRTYTEGVSLKMQQAEQQKVADVQKIKTEFNFTDDDIAEAEKFFSQQTVSHYNLLKLALMDKIITRKLSSIPSTPPITPDLTQHRSTTEEPPQKKADVSDGGRRMLSRIGPKSAIEKTRR